ncbi:hypothetical protein [Streptomyces sp. B1866]|uniref:trypsin-like serine peptidase n=1 Tax=Streptomyces sp. B1866 TaxID=3075431 RepID=UPI00289B3A58|nr:hypothetical protein [Streptomyces sp. B1866]
MIVSDTKNAVWTAAHCLHKGSGGRNGFFKNFAFIPSYQSNDLPWGVWTARRVIVTDTWANDGDFDDNDLGALVLNRDSRYGNIQDAIGAWGYRFDGGTAHSNTYSYGYPADGYNRPQSDFDGEHLMYCQGKTVDADNLNPSDDRLRMDCDMGHGASGGPMATGVPDSPKIVGSNSHRRADSHHHWVDNHLFSSNHGREAVAVIRLVDN